jgi:hypothetical protein
MLWYNLQLKEWMREERTGNVRVALHFFLTKMPQFSICVGVAMEAAKCEGGYKYQGKDETKGGMERGV